MEREATIPRQEHKSRRTSDIDNGAVDVSGASMTRHYPKCFVFIIKSSKQPVLYEGYNYDPCFTDKETEAKKKFK